MSVSGGKKFGFTNLVFICVWRVLLTRPQTVHEYATPFFLLGPTNSAVQVTNRAKQQEMQALGIIAVIISKAVRSFPVTKRKGTVLGHVVKYV